MLSGAAIDCATPLIKNLHDAKLLWVAEEILSGGRGAVLSRGGFAMYPYAWQNTGFGGFSGPAIAGGSHNWVWTIASNDRIFTSGVLMFTTGAAGFQRMPGRLSLELADGYTAPIKPAIADGRLLARLGDKLVCYDLRQDRDQNSQMIELTAENGYASSIEPGSPV